jgi:hypothetical protein
MTVGRAEQRLPQSFPYRSPSYFEVLRFAVGRCQVGYLDSGFKALPLVPQILSLTCYRNFPATEPRRSWNH